MLKTKPFVWFLAATLMCHVSADAADQTPLPTQKGRRNNLSSQPARLLTHQVNQYGTWLIFKERSPELPPRHTQLTVVFLSAESEVVISHFDVGSRSVEMNLPSGTVRCRQLPNGKWVIKMISAAGHNWTSVVDSSGQPDAPEYERTLERGIAEVIEPSRTLLELAEESAVVSGMVDLGAMQGLDQRSVTKASPLFHCVVSAAGWIASWGSIAGCATGIGCIGAVALMTATSIAMADSCAEAANGL